MPSELLFSCHYSERQVPFERHFHNVYEMVYVCSGKALFQIENFCYEAGEKSLVFISKLEAHSVKILEGEYRRYYLLLSPFQLERTLEDPRLRAIFVSRPAGFCHCFSVAEIAGKAEALLAVMAEETQNQGELSDVYCKALLNQLMVDCYRLRGSLFPTAEQKRDHAVYQVQSYLDRHFAEDLSISDLAQKFFLSPSYLSHAFRSWSGCSPKQYIMHCRISCARELLMTSDLSVSSVSARCGFGDVNNFIRFFRRETGMTPAHYRKSLRSAP